MNFEFIWNRQCCDIYHDDITDWEEECVVTVNVLSLGHPGVMNPIDKAEPPEGPEVEIVSVVTAYGIDLYSDGLLSDEELEAIETLALENIPEVYERDYGDED